MIRPGICVVAINSEHSNEILKVSAIINGVEGRRFVDTKYQKQWKPEDFREANECEVIEGFRRDLLTPKYEWSMFPSWVNWVFIQPNKTLVLSSQRPHGYTLEHGYYFLKTDSKYQILEVKDHDYKCLYSSASLEQRPVNLLAESA